MTFHTKRQRPGRGAYTPRVKHPGSVFVSTRLRPEEVEFFQAEAERRGVPLAGVVREALRDFILRGPAYEPPAS